MKRLLYLIMITTLLCGCGSSKNNSQLTAETTTKVESIADVDTMRYYSSVSEFLSSEFYDGLSERGINIYTLSYDEERFEFNKINADANFYNYILYDKENEKQISFTVNYDVTMTSMSALRSIFNNDANIRTTAENSSGSHEVYLATSPYDDEVNYGLLYLPFEKYVVSIYAYNSTDTEILEYFDDFELVADNG